MDKTGPFRCEKSVRKPGKAAAFGIWAVLDDIMWALCHFLLEWCVRVVKPEHQAIFINLFSLLNKAGYL
jgi:hypothetical protein